MTRMFLHGGGDLRRERVWRSHLCALIKERNVLFILSFERQPLKINIVKYQL